MTEKWRPVPGYPRYEVSSLGRVRSFARYSEGRVLRPGKSGRFGYATVALGRGNSRCVHDLVAAAFLGPRPEGADVAHLDGNGADSRPENLAYKTRRENNFDRARLDRCVATRAQVAAIRAAGWVHGTGAFLARQFGLSESQVSNIRHGRQRPCG